eukprot:5914930-Prymnesium_polylepis.1
MQRPQNLPLHTPRMKRVQGRVKVLLGRDAAAPAGRAPPPRSAVCLRVLCGHAKDRGVVAQYQGQRDPQHPTRRWPVRAFAVRSPQASGHPRDEPLRMVDKGWVDRLGGGCRLAHAEPVVVAVQQLVIGGEEARAEPFRVGHDPPRRVGAEPPRRLRSEVAARDQGGVVESHHTVEAVNTGSEAGVHQRA